MGRVFAVCPKRVKRTNGQVLTPDMEITVTTLQYTSDPFYNGGEGDTRAVHAYVPVRL